MEVPEDILKEVKPHAVRNSRDHCTGSFCKSHGDGLARTAYVTIEDNNGKNHLCIDCWISHTNTLYHFFKVYLCATFPYGQVNKDVTTEEEYAEFKEWFKQRNEARMGDVLPGGCNIPADGGPIHSEERPADGDGEAGGTVRVDGGSGSDSSEVVEEGLPKEQDGV